MAEVTEGQPAATEAPAPQANETFEQSMYRLGWDTSLPHSQTSTPAATEETAGDAADDTADAAEAKPEKVEKPAKAKLSGKPKAKAKSNLTKATDAEAVESDKADRAELKAAADSGEFTEEQLKAMAEKLGYVFEGGKIRARDKVEWRNHQKRSRKEIQALREKAESEIARMREEAKQDLDYAKALRAARDQHDFDGVAKQLGFKDWNDLQLTHLEQQKDPNYRRLKALEAKDAERTAAEQKRQEQEKQLAEQERQRNAEINIKRQNSDIMSASEDKLLVELADDPLLADIIYRIQEQNWDGQSYPDPAEAIDMAMEGVTTTVRDDYKALWEKLNRVFGSEQESAEDDDEEDDGIADTDPAPAPVAKRRVMTKTSNHGKPRIEPAHHEMPKDEAGISRYFQERLREAGEAERRAAAAKR